MTGAGIFGLLIALGLSSIVLMLVVTLLWWLDRYDREPIHLVVEVFLWGATAAPAISIFMLSSFYERLASGGQGSVLTMVLASLAGPTIEELAKGAGILLVVLLTREFDNPTDGMVYGTAVGLGFAVTETVLYGIAASAANPNQPTVTLIVIAGRTVMTAGIHALSSATLGGFLGYAQLRRRSAAWLLLSLVGLGAAVALHTSWNLALLFVGPVAETGHPRIWLVVVPGLYVIYLLVFAAFLRLEHHILKRELEEEVALGLTPTWVADVIPYYRRRIRGDWWPSRPERTVISRLLTRLAFRKHTLRNRSANVDAVASLEVVWLRKRVREILGPEEKSRL
ncbi:MAG: PrsW family intramembrane metalloprotease [Thermoanaerobaculales bacterium]